MNGSMGLTAQKSRTRPKSLATRCKLEDEEKRESAELQDSHFAVDGRKGLRDILAQGRCYLYGRTYACSKYQVSCDAQLCAGPLTDSPRGRVGLQTPNLTDVGIDGYT